MKRRTRTFLFFLFLVLFFIATGLIIAYSQGYRADFANFRVVQTGALYLEPRPAPAELYLNGKLKKRSNALFQNIFATNLLPNTYHVEIKKEGYGTWEKNLAVAPKLVTEAKNILLFKTQNAPHLITERAKNFFVSPSGNKIIFTEQSDVPEMRLASPESGESRLILKASERFLNYEVFEAQWNKDETLLLVLLRPRKTEGNSKSNSQDLSTWLIVNLQEKNSEAIDAGNAILSSNEFAAYTKNLFKPNIANLHWSKDESRKFFFTAHDADFGTFSSYLFAYDLTANKISEPLAYDVRTYELTETGKVLYISSYLQTINSLDLGSLKIQQVSFTPPAYLSDASDMSFISAEPIVLLIDGGVYLFNEKLLSIQKIADEVTRALFSSDKKKLLLVSSSSLAVYWTYDVHVQPFHDAGDSLSITPEASMILDAVWLTKDNEHVIFANQNSIKVTELDGRDKRNIATLATDIRASHLSYGESRDVLYYLAGNTLYSMSLK